MDTYSFLQLEGIGSVVSVTLNRPEVHNAFNDILIGELTAVIEKLGADAQVRVILLKGAGRSFCAGADLNWMRQTVNYSFEQNLSDARKLADMIRTIHECSKPVIASIHGSAFGGGIGLIAACDIAMAVQSAEFAFSEVRLGIVPAIIAPFVLAKIGAGAARRYFLTAERFSAHEAHRIGLIHQVVADQAALSAAVKDRIGQLLDGAPQALSLSKKLIGLIDRTDLDAALNYGIEAIANARASEEGQGGMRAFLEKQPPPWKRA